MHRNLLNGVIDMHVHSNPDIRIRAYDDFELTNAAVGQCPADFPFPLS